MIYDFTEYELGFSLKPPKWLRKTAKNVGHSISVNAKNAKKALKKISMNKIVDSMTPDIPLDTTNIKTSPIKKYLPIALSAAVLLPLLFGDD
jgi:hypothetical protein